jgi:hypothetical protein
MRRDVQRVDPVSALKFQSAFCKGQSLGECAKTNLDDAIKQLKSAKHRVALFHALRSSHASHVVAWERCLAEARRQLDFLENCVLVKLVGCSQLSQREVTSALKWQTFVSAVAEVRFLTSHQLTVETHLPSFPPYRWFESAL